MSMNQTNKISKRCLALITALSLILTMVVVAVGTIQWPEKLVGFEKSDLAYSQWTALGSTEVDLTLPETLRAMVSIPNEMDVSTFQQATPLGDVSTGDLMYDYYNYGYVVCAEAEEKYAAGEKVIYSVYYAGEDGGVASVGYRLYGSLEGTGDLWFVCDANGNIQYGIIDVPVIWSGAYDGNTLGTYTYTCEVSPSSTYGYNGTMPTAEIYVGDPESEAYSCSHSTEDGVCEDCVYDAYNTLQASRIAYSTETTNETAEYTQNLEDYMTANIATVKNSGGTGVTEGIITGPWVDYLNTLWHNRVKTMVWTGEGEVIPWNTAWTPSAVLWDGTRAYSNDHDADWGAIYYPDYDSTTKTYTVYYGSQLLYAMEACHNNPGATISIMSDINLNGENYAWPGVELTTSVTIEGNGHTIYNLCSFTDQSDTTKGFATFVQGTGVEFTVKDLHFETGLLVCSMTSNGTSDVPDLGTSDAANISLFRWKGYNTESSFTLDNVTANGFIACSVGSCVSVLIDMFYSGNANDTECYNTITNCAVSNSYIYGMDHIGALGSYTSNVAFTNCYSINNTLVGYGYHSGAFVSCLNNRSTFDSCFSANNYMYSAMYAGGFTGFAGDGADYTNCYSSGKVEGFLYVGGFTGSADAGYQSVAEPYNETITRNYCTFTNCYSTALVGIRTETSYSGGFIGRVEYAYDRYPNGQNIFTNCYAAGEVGNTSTDLNTNEKVVGGFIGWDDTLGTDYESVYINCYYDKQTTAMREWVTGYYDTSTVDTSGLNGNLTNGITGVLTTDTEKSGAGLTDTPSNEGFVGFTNNFDQIQAIVDKNSAAYTLKVSEYVGAPLDLGTVDDVKWVYTDEYYPQLSIFSDANNNTSAWGTSTPN
ncbi:hypothetical protein RFF05_08585 [Bengtsoniella intestinalis]|uniref:hypothetical protein n=1 Tax=Bengtsoniella intestinalis TaxID=3073143 RepID=UPI00391F20CC